MKKWFRPCLLICLAACGIRSAIGTLETMENLDIDFTDAKSAADKAEWSAGVNANAHGLGFDGDATAISDGWIMTKPLAVGCAWRPEVATSVSVEVKPAPHGVQYPNGTSSPPETGTMYVRYSADRKHWSTWQVLAGDENEAATQPPKFHGLVEVPKRQRERYSKFLQEYMALDVPWTSDEEAAVRWIVGKEPNFFDTELPFVGYVQFFYEMDFRGGQRLQSLVVQADGSVGGVCATPKDEAGLVSELEKHRGPWRYVAP